MLSLWYINLNIFSAENIGGRKYEIIRWIPYKYHDYNLLLKDKITEVYR
jgi:hypothetical protein